MFKNLKLLILISFLFLSSNNSYSEEKIVFIDIDYVYENSTVGKKINSEIEKKVKALENQFNKNKKTVDDSKDKLSKQKNVLSEEELNKILQNYATKNSINLIISKNNILLGKNNLDVTKEILSILDKEVKTIKIK